MAITLSGTTGITTPADTITGNATVGGTLAVTGATTVGGVAVVAVAPGTNGNVLTSNGSAWASTAPTSIVPTPSAVGQIPFSTDGSTYTATQKITQGTAVATTSGTAIDFTSIPSWVKRITIVFNTVTFSGAAVLYVQLGTSAGIDATSYVATGTLTTGAAGGATVSSTTSYVVRTGSGYSITGSMTIRTLSSNLWVSDHTGTGGGGLSLFGGGVKTLSGTLDRLRITSSTGTDTFTVGSVNILYE